MYFFFIYLKLSVLSQEIGYKDPLMIPNDVEILSTKTGLKRYIFLFFVKFIIFAFILFVSYRS